MALSSSLQAYGDCMDFFERVIDDPKGGRVYIGQFEKAHHFRMRCNQARKLHREQNARIFGEEDIRHGVSDYDPLCLQIRQDTQGGFWVYAIRMQLDASQIELLSEIDDTAQIEAADAPMLIEDHSEGADDNQTSS